MARNLQEDPLGEILRKPKEVSKIPSLAKAALDLHAADPHTPKDAEALAIRGILRALSDGKRGAISTHESQMLIGAGTTEIGRAVGALLEELVL